MKVLLLEDVAKLGWLGDVVEVKDGYARNYLVPFGLATIPTEDNIKRIADAKAQRAAERKAASEKLAGIAKSADGTAIEIQAKANEQGVLFGSVSSEEIAAKLRAKGLEISDDYVVLSEHIKEVGSYDVTLKLAADIKAHVTVTVVAQGEEIESTDENKD